MVLVHILKSGSSQQTSKDSYTEMMEENKSSGNSSWSCGMLKRDATEVALHSQTCPNPSELSARWCISRWWLSSGVHFFCPPPARAQWFEFCIYKLQYHHSILYRVYAFCTDFIVILFALQIRQAGWGKSLMTGFCSWRSIRLTWETL